MKNQKEKGEKESIKLSVKQELFIKEYLVDFNATQAAIRAGYSEKTSYSIGFENLKKPEIQVAIAQAIKERTKSVDLSVEWVLEGFKEIRERCMQVKPVMVKVNGEWVESGEFKFDSAGANKANENIGRYFKMFTDNMKMSGELDLKGISVNFVTPEDEGRIK